MAFPPFSKIHLLFLFHVGLCKQSPILKASFLSHLELYHLAELNSRQQSIACGSLPMLAHWMERQLCSAASTNSLNFLPLTVLHVSSSLYWLHSISGLQHPRREFLVFWCSSSLQIWSFEEKPKVLVLLATLSSYLPDALALQSWQSVRQQQRSGGCVRQSTINRWLSPFTPCSLDHIQDTAPHFPPPTPFLKDLKKLEWVQWSHEDDQPLTSRSVRGGWGICTCSSWGTQLNPC